MTISKSGVGYSRSKKNPIFCLEGSLNQVLLHVVKQFRSSEEAHRFCASVLFFSSLESASLSTLALGPMEISLTGIMTLLTLGSVTIFLESAVYLYKNTRCPIKRKTLLWSSSAPTVRAL